MPQMLQTSLRGNRVPARYHRRMKSHCLLLLSLCMAWLPVFAAENVATTPARSRFTAPFAVRDGIIRDAAGREVRLWGVNYYAPFAHNYLNIAEVGADYREAIAEDVAQFRLLGLDFVRIHVYDREITDAEGHLTPNRHLEVFDLLLEELDRSGIFLMLTPVVWWNTPENQALMDRHYAFWHIGVGGSFGFSNYYGKDELIWNEDAIRCQERYMAELLNHRSSISGRRYADFPNLVAIEPFNEPLYVDLEMLSKAPDQAKPGSMEGVANSGAAALTRACANAGRIFAARIPAMNPKSLAEFQGDLLQKYLERMFAAIDGAMKRPYLRAHIDTLLASEPIHDALAAAKVDAYSSGCYLAGDRGFDSSWNDHLNFLDLARGWRETMVPVAGQKSLAHIKAARAGREAVIEKRIMDRPRIVYEFDAPSTVEGYPFGAMALAFAARGAQMAAMFTYTPDGSRRLQPGLARALSEPAAHTRPRRGVCGGWRDFPARSHWRPVARRFAAVGGAGLDHPTRSRFGDVLGRQPAHTLRNSCRQRTLPRPRPRPSSPAVRRDLSAPKATGSIGLKRAGDGAWELTVFPERKDGE